jgi:hypothetical protein
MIHYQLRCDSEHEFDGWFKDSAGFDQQAERGLISCPVCGGTKMNRALMAPRVARKSRTIDAEPETASAAAPAVQASGVLPDSVRAALNRLRTEVEKNCDYVGKDFAQVARKIHNGEEEPRGIYGETTPGEAEALADDGIEVSTIPWLPRADS